MRQGDELFARALIQDEKSIRLIQQDKNCGALLRVISVTKTQGNGAIP